MYNCVSETKTKANMIVIPQGKKIVIIAVSLFVTTFSTVLYFIDGDHQGAESAKTSVLESFFKHEDQYSTYLEQKEPVLAVTSSGEIVDGNDAFVERFDYEIRDLVSKSLFTLINPSDLPEFVSSLTTIGKDGKVIVNDGPYRFMGSDGRDHVVLVSFSLVKNGGGSEKVILLVFKDITDSLDAGDAKDSKSSGKTIKDTKDSKEGEKRIIVEKTG